MALGPQQMYTDETRHRNVPSSDPELPEDVALPGMLPQLERGSTVAPEQQRRILHLFILCHPVNEVDAIVTLWPLDSSPHRIDLDNSHEPSLPLCQWQRQGKRLDQKHPETYKVPR